jgi:hypothetical protein
MTAIEEFTANDVGGIIGPTELPFVQKLNAMVRRLNLVDALIPEGAAARFTEEGGLAVQLINKTGAATIKGTLVEVDSTVDRAFSVVPADAIDCIGSVYEDGIADGELAWVVVSGIADVLLEDGTATTRDYWVKVSDTVAGRADGSNAAPPGGTVGALEDHMSEIGHSLESKGSGTDVLARILLHFN